MRGPAADHTHRVETPGLQFSDCQPCRKSGAARRPDRGPGSGVGREKRAPWGTRPAQPGRGAKPGHRPRAPRSPQRGRRGGGAQGRAPRHAQRHERGTSKPAQARARSKAPGGAATRPRPKAAGPPGPEAAAPEAREAGRGGGDPAGPRAGARRRRSGARATEQGARSRSGCRSPNQTGPASARGAAQRRTSGRATEPGGSPGGRARRAKRGPHGPDRAREAAPGAPRRSGPRRGRGPGAKGAAECTKKGPPTGGTGAHTADGDEAQRRSRAARVGPLWPRAPGRSPPHHCGGCGAVEAPQCAPGPEGERGPPCPRWRAAPWAGGRGAPPLGGAREAGGRSPISSASRASFT